MMIGVRRISSVFCGLWKRLQKGTDSMLGAPFLRAGAARMGLRGFIY